MFLFCDASRWRAATPDRELVRRVLASDPNAEALLLARLLPHLRAVARAVLPSLDAEDGVQAASLRVLEGLSGYRGDATLVRWARTIAMNACLRLRQQNLRRRAVLDAIAQASPASWDREPRLRESVPRPVTAYLERLSPAHQEAVVLRHVWGHSVAEVAQLVGAPVDTVKSRLFYARRTLRALVRRDMALLVRDAENRR